MDNEETCYTTKIECLSREFLNGEKTLNDIRREVGSPVLDMPEADMLFVF